MRQKPTMKISQEGKEKLGKALGRHGTYEQAMDALIEIAKETGNYPIPESKLPKSIIPPDIQTESKEEINEDDIEEVNESPEQVNATSNERNGLDTDLSLLSPRVNQNTDTSSPSLTPVQGYQQGTSEDSGVGQRQENKVSDNLQLPVNQRVYPVDTNINTIVKPKKKLVHI